jgi:hypothetical protein
MAEAGSGAADHLAVLAWAAICAHILASPFTGAEDEPVEFPGPLSSVMDAPPSRPFSFLIPPFEKSLCPISILALVNEVDNIVVESLVVEFTVCFGPFVLVANAEVCLVVVVAVAAYQTYKSVVLSTSIK